MEISLYFPSFGMLVSALFGYLPNTPQTLRNHPYCENGGHLHSPLGACATRDNARKIGKMRYETYALSVPLGTWVQTVLARGGRECIR